MNYWLPPKVNWKNAILAKTQRLLCHIKSITCALQVSLLSMLVEEYLTTFTVQSTLYIFIFNCTIHQWWPRLGLKSWDPYPNIENSCLNMKTGIENLRISALISRREGDWDQGLWKSYLNWNWIKFKIKKKFYLRLIIIKKNYKPIYKTYKPIPHANKLHWILWCVQIVAPI